MTARKVKNVFVLGFFGLLFIFIVFVSFSFLYQSLVQPSVPIENIQVSNVSENSLTLSWVSYKSMKVRVYYSPYPIPSLARIVLRVLPGSLASRLFGLKIAGDDFGPMATTVHHITLTDLKPETEYYYLISTGWRFYTQDIDGQPLPTIRTASLLETAPFPFPCYGKVIDFAEEMPDSPVIVYAFTEGSSLISAYTNSAGNYTLDLAGLRTEDLTRLFDLSQKETLVLKAEGGLWGKISQPLYLDSCQPVGLLRLE